jgi:hypothetical protein
LDEHSLATALMCFHSNPSVLPPRIPVLKARVYNASKRSSVAAESNARTSCGVNLYLFTLNSRGVYVLNDVVLQPLQSILEYICWIVRASSLCSFVLPRLGFMYILIASL